MGFRLTAIATAMFTVVMSLFPVLAYVGMVPTIHSDVLFRMVIWRAGPILIGYIAALVAALLLNPAKRPLIGASLLIATTPAAVTLMLYGLR